MAEIPQQMIAEARAGLGIPDERIPHHVAIIMDGNGRWASSRGLPRTIGHAEGGKSVRKIINASAKLGLEAFTFYYFSI